MREFFAIFLHWSNSESYRESSTKFEVTSTDIDIPIEFPTPNEKRNDKEYIATSGLEKYKTNKNFLI